MRNIYTACVKAIRFVLLFLTISLIAFKSIAQLDISIGTGTVGNTSTGYPCPIQDYYEGSRAQYLYKASELIAAGMSPGNIVSIKYNITNLNGAGLVEQLGIKILGTTATTLSLTSWEPGATQVYGLTNYQPVIGINTFTFSTPFFWNGTDNIIVETCNGDPNTTSGTLWTNNPTIPWTTGLSFTASHTYRADDLNNLCASTTTTNTGTGSTRPNITFGWISATPCTGTPSGVVATANPTTVCLGQTISLQATNIPLVSGLTYQWQVSTNGTTWTDITGATSIIASTTQTVTSQYRVLVTCTSVGGGTFTTAPISVVSPPVPTGNFTINKTLPTNWPTVTTNANFNSFNDAYNAVKCGIGGPVVFDVVSGTGPYNEQLIMNEVPNASATNTITFNGNGNTISFGSTNTNERAVIKLKGADYIRFYNLKIDANGGTYGFGFHLTSDADYNIIKQCTINASLTSTSTTETAGIAISGTDNSPIGTGTTTALNDFNVIDSNIINGGYYGITLTATFAGGANGNNQFTNNQIMNFHSYGIYVVASYNTLIQRNKISRPDRTVFADFYGIHFASQSNSSNINANRIFNPYGANNVASNAFYGINFSSTSATAGSDNFITNNLIYGANGNGIVYGINNTSSNNIWYFHNTISFDSTTSTSTANTRGYNQSGTSNGILFYNNLISITRGGTGTKYCVYTNTQFNFADNNNYYLNAAAGTNYIGYLTTNRSLLADWKAANLNLNNEQNSISVTPVFTDPSYAVANYSPNNAGMDNKGLYVGIDFDINNQARSNTTPDIGAYEYAPSPCTLPIVTGTVNMSATSICENLPVVLGLNIGAFGANQSFQWQTGPTATGPWTSIGNPMATPDTTILSSSTFYYRCEIKCGTSADYSNAVLLNVNPALPAGTYTINAGAVNSYVPGIPGGNFTSFNEVKTAMGCGVKGIGNVIVNVVANSGPYNEQLILDSIAGVNENRRLIFNGNNNTIAFSSANNNERAVIKLNAADYITFNELVINATGANAYGYGIQLINNADSNVIKKCTIITLDNSSSTNYAGIIINASHSNANSVGNTFCDGNNIDSNTVKGGYYGLTLMGSSTQPLLNNKITNNQFLDYYNYGIYSGGTNGTLIDGNLFSRPTRTTFNTAYGMYFTSAASNGTIINANRFTKFYGGNATASNGIYGIYHNNVSASAGNPIMVSNNLFYNLDGTGIIYALYNQSSANISYIHNTISIDNTNVSSNGPSAGFYQSTSTTGLQFLNNIVTIRRSSTGVKNAIYISTATSEVTSNYNNIIVEGTGSNVNFGTIASNSYNSLTTWKAGTSKDANSISFEPLYLDTANGNYKPAMAAIDNKGTGTTVTTDILKQTRNATTPDVGAYEFSPQPCASPLLAGTASVTPNSGLCLEVPIRLTLAGHSPIGSMTFQWQASTSASGPWVNFGAQQYTPTFDSLTSTTNFYRCEVKCSGTTVYSTVTSVTLNPILVGGTYTIDATQPQTWPGPPGSNFQTVQSAVSALLCGMTGSVVFNVKGSYNEQIRIPYVPGTSFTRTVTFQSYNGLPSGAELTFNATDPSKNYILQLDSTKYFFFKNMTFTATNTTNGRAIDLTGIAAYDSIVGSSIQVPITTTTSNTIVGIHAASFKGSNISIKGNTIQNGSMGVYFSGFSPVQPSSNNYIADNTVTGAYYHGMNIQYQKLPIIKSNTVNVFDNGFTIMYGIYLSDCDSSINISNNKININNNANTVYGLWMNNSDGSNINRGLIANNDIAATTGNTGTIYGFWINNSPFVDVKNNAISVNTSGTSSYGLYVNNSPRANYYNNAVNNYSSSSANNYAAYIFNSSTQDLVFRNNIFSNKGGGKAMFVYNPAFLNSNYNMLYSSGATLVQQVLPANTNFTDLESWKSSSTQDVFSIVYNPAFISNSNLKPNVTTPDVWAMHGRGVQIDGNNLDHDGNNRPTTLLTGVPDLGAYEFYPSTTLPTVLTAIPATPAANTEQAFMYGTDTVMKIKWAATAPPSVEVRRYSGVVPTGLAAGNLDSMYFYTKVDIPGGGNYDYGAKLFYIDPWLGSIASLTSGVHQLGLGKTTPGNAWVVGYTSRNNVAKRMINQDNVSYLDKFTGLINPYAPPVLPDKDSSNRGKHFYFAYAKNQLNAGTSQQMIVYLSAADQAANVTVRVNGTGWVRNYTVPVNTVIASEYLPKTGTDNAFLNTEGIFDRSIEIISDVPIVAYAHAIGSASSGASMLLPVGTWGYEYKTLCINGTGSYSDSRPFFYVIADNDNTTFEINPSVAVANAGITAGVSNLITLNKGQVLQVLSTNATSDLTGSTVKSVANSAGKCYPVAVFSGNSRINLTLSGCSSGGDFFMQQNFPATAWGKNYLIAPTSFSGAANTLATNVFRVAVQDPTTVVKRNGTIMTGIVNNHYYEFQTNAADFIEADKPIMVAQFTGGGSCVGGSGVGDPEMFYISPIEQGINKVAFYRNTEQSISVNYLTMIVPTNGLTSLKIIDGSTIVTPDYVYAHPSNGNPTLKGVNYSVVVKRWTSLKEQVRVECDSSFTGITYGLGSVESYGYNMGTLVKNLRATGAINNTLSTSGNDQYTCSNAPFQISMLLPVKPTNIIWKISQVPNITPNVNVTDNSPVASDSMIVNGQLLYQFTLPGNYTFSQPGLYSIPVTFAAPTIGSCDNSQTDLLYVQVIPAPSVGFNITFAGCAGNTAQFMADAATPNGINVTSWNWTFNNATTATGPNTSFTYPTAGTYTEKLSVITADGCLRDTSRQVVVNPLPVVTVTTDSIAVCSGNNATFTISSPISGATYSWFNSATGGTAVATGTSYTINNVTATTEMWIEAVSAANCTSTSRKRIVANLLLNLAAPVVTVSNSSPTSVTFSWVAVPGAATYQVSVNGAAYVSPSSGATGLTHTVTGLGTLVKADIMVQALGSIPCQTGTSTAVSGCSNSIPATTPDSLAICINSNGAFQITAPLPTNIVYNWYNVSSGGTALTNGVAYTINTVGSNFTVNNATPAGIYNYYVLQSNTVTGCVATNRKKVVLNVLDILAKPIVTAPQSTITPTSITFNWVSVPGATGYQVSINNGTTWVTPSSGSNGLSHVVSGLLPNTSVTIIVKALGILSCQNTNSDAFTGKTLIDQIFVPNAFNPNSNIPANRTLRVYGYVIQSMNFNIFNQWGEKVFETTNQSIGWDGNYKGKQQPSGVYMYVLQMTLLNGTNTTMKGSINLIR